jgi:hypothetical protein
MGGRTGRLLLIGTKTIVHVVGARPNYMKIAPIIEALRPMTGLRQILVNTGQHYDEAMAGAGFRNVRDDGPYNTVVRDDTGCEVDVHFVDLDETYVDERGVESCASRAHDVDGVEIVGRLPITQKLHTDFRAGIGGRQDLRHEEKAFRVELISRYSRHHDDIRLGLKIRHPRKADCNFVIGVQTAALGYETLIEKLAKVQRNPLVRQAWRCHHHGRTLDQVPAFFLRPHFEKRHELVHVHGSRERPGGCIHGHGSPLRQRTVPLEHGQRRSP